MPRRHIHPHSSHPISRQLEPQHTTIFLYRSPSCCSSTSTLCICIRAYGNTLIIAIDLSKTTSRQTTNTHRCDTCCFLVVSWRRPGGTFLLSSSFSTCLLCLELAGPLPRVCRTGSVLSSTPLPRPARLTRASEVPLTRTRLHFPLLSLVRYRALLLLLSCR